MAAAFPMIIRPRPHGWQLLYILKGSVLQAISRKVLAIGLLALAVSAFAEVYHPAGIERFTVIPFSLFGLVLSIFLSFRNNGCYERWWEARKQWGALVFESRSLVRQCEVLLADEPERLHRVTYLVIGFAHALEARLRGTDMQAASARWLPDADLALLKKRNNVPNQILTLITAELAQPLREGRLDSILYAQFDERIQSMSAIQTACERIATTPLPFAYTLLLHRCAWLFCILLPFGFVTALGWATPVVSVVLAYAFFGMDQISDEIEEPFGLAPNDLPIHALVRVIEIDLREALGERDLPIQLLPDDYLLQ